MRKTFLLKSHYFKKFPERQLRFIASGIILQNCLAVKRCRQFLLTVCCVRHAFQKLRQISGFSTQTVSILSNRFLLRCGKSKFAQCKVCVSKPPSLNSSNRRQCTKRQCTYFNFYLFTLVRFNLCLFTLVCLNIVLFVLWFCLQDVVVHKGRQFPDHCVRNSFGVTPYCFLNCRLK